MHFQKLKEKSFLREQFNKLKPRTVQLQSIPCLPIEGRQMLRDVITQHIIKNMDISQKSGSKKRNQANMPSIKRKNYEPIEVVIQINGKTQKIQFDITQFLDKYIEFEKKNIYRHYNVEPLIIDILNFLDGMDEMSKELGIQIEEGNGRNQKILNMLIQKYHKDKQRNSLMCDYDQIKRKTIGKYKRVSFIQFDGNLLRKECELLVEKSVDDNSQRISRSTVSRQSKEEQKQSNLKLLNASKLKLLVQSCNIFKHPQKIEQLRKQKLIEQYCQGQADFIEIKQSCKQNLAIGTKKNQSYSMDCLKFLQDWVSEMNLSEKLFKKKNEPKQQNPKNQIKKQEDSSFSSDDDSLNI